MVLSIPLTLCFDHYPILSDCPNYSWPVIPSPFADKALENGFTKQICCDFFCEHFGRFAKVFVAARTSRWRQSEVAWIALMDRISRVNGILGKSRQFVALFLGNGRRRNFALRIRLAHCPRILYPKCMVLRI